MEVDQEHSHPSQTPEVYRLPSTSPFPTSRRVIPQALQNLVSKAGVSFHLVPEQMWLVNGWSLALKKNLPVSFFFESDISSADIVTSFQAVGIAYDQIVSIQRKALNCTWCVSFTSLEVKRAAMETPRIQIAGIYAHLGDADYRTATDKIYESPDELPDAVIIGRLSLYGEVHSFRRDRGPVTGIRNGIRMARMQLERHIPSAVSVAGKMLLILYASQP